MFKYLLLASAFLIATSAGFFSVTGIGQLFLGAPIAAMVMAATLELGKLVAVSFTYRYWARIHGIMRTYFVVASAILMIITSVGIYGYLSSAYATAATGVQATQNQVSLVTTQQQSINQSIARLTNRAQSLESVRTKQEARLDALVGRRGLADQQRVVQEADKQINTLQAQITTLSNQRDSLESVKTTLQTSVTTNGKIGTFYYIAETMGISLDTIVKWFILAIVLVFDPLSVTLILAYNVARTEEPESDIEECPILPPELPLETVIEVDSPITAVEQVNPVEPYSEPIQAIVPSVDVDDVTRRRFGVDIS